MTQGGRKGRYYLTLVTTRYSHSSVFGGTADIVIVVVEEA